MSNRITHAFEDIGPARAAEILKKVHVRQEGRDYKTVIKRYSDQMKRGLWDEGVVQTISISDRNELIDGYHRLHAIIESGVTLRILVVRGVKSESFGKYDSGKARSLAFRAQIERDEAAVCSLLIRIAQRGRTKNGAVPIEDMAIARSFIADEIEMFSILVPKTKKKGTWSAPVKLGLMLQMKKNKNMAYDMLRHFTCLQTGDFSQMPRIFSNLYRRLLDDRPEPLAAFVFSYKAFDPANADLSKLGWKDFELQLEMIRDGVLAPLVAKSEAAAEASF